MRAFKVVFPEGKQKLIYSMVRQFNVRVAYNYTTETPNVGQLLLDDEPSLGVPNIDGAISWLKDQAVQLDEISKADMPDLPFYWT